jgi:hypothetical protein
LDALLTWVGDQEAAAITSERGEVQTMGGMQQWRIVNRRPLLKIDRDVWRATAKLESWVHLL